MMTFNIKYVGGDCIILVLYELFLSLITPSLLFDILLTFFSIKIQGITL